MGNSNIYGISTESDHELDDIMPYINISTFVMYTLAFSLCAYYM